MTFGLIGLIIAANKYDPTKGVAFTTFAVSCIRTEILKEYNKNKRHSIDLDPEKVVYLEEVVFDDIKFIDIIHDDFDMDTYITDKEEINLLHRAIEKLEPKEQLIVKYYYFQDMPQEEVAEKINTSHQNVSLKLRKIRGKLRDIMSRKI